MSNIINYYLYLIYAVILEYHHVHIPTLCKSMLNLHNQTNITAGSVCSWPLIMESKNRSKCYYETGYVWSI